MRQTAHMLMGAMMLPMPAMAEDFDIHKCDHLYRTGSKQFFCPYGDGDRGSRALLLEDGKLMPAPDGEYRALAVTLGQEDPRFLVDQGRPYFYHDTAQLADSKGELRFYSDNTAILTQRAFYFQRVHHEPANGTFTTKDGLSIHAENGEIRIPNDAKPYMTCNYAKTPQADAEMLSYAMAVSPNKKEYIACEDRD